MTRIDGGNYDYHQAYSYVGSSGARHYKYCLVYVPAGRSSSCNQHGYYAYNEQLVYFNMTTRSRDCNPSRSPFEWTDKDNDKKYILTASMCSGSHVWSWEERANMRIDNVYADSTATPGDTEPITVDIVNSGGSGNFDLVMYDGDIEIDRIIDRSFSGAGSSRENLYFIMLNHEMTLTIKLIDNYDGVVVDEVTHTTSLVEPEPEPDPEPDPDPDPPFVCNDGEMRGKVVCSDGSVIYGEVCRNNTWVSSGEKCPSDPEPDPDLDLDGNWITYILIGTLVILFYFLAMRG